MLTYFIKYKFYFILYYGKPNYQNDTEIFFIYVEKSIFLSHL